MDIKELKTSIKTNSIPTLIIFNVENQALAKQYITSMSSTLNKHFKYYDTADQVLYETSTNLREDFIYIILNDEKILKNPNYIEELSKTGRNIIVYFPNMDKQSTFYKQNGSLIVDFKQLDKYTILSYMMKQLDKAKINVAQEKVEQLIDFCNCDLGCCLNELDKIITLNQSSSNLLFDYMMHNGFSDYRKTNIFEFVSKIINKDSTVFDDAMRLDENLVGLMMILYKNAKTKFVSTSNPRYLDIMRLCSKLDSAIKDGSLKDKYLLDYILLKVC